MNTRLDEQLERYGDFFESALDEIAPEVSAPAQIRLAARPAPAPWWRRSWAIAVAGALGALALVGGGMLLTRTLDGDTTADTASTASTTVPTPATTVASPTTAAPGTTTAPTTVATTAPASPIPVFEWRRFRVDPYEPKMEMRDAASAGDRIVAVGAVSDGYGDDAAVWYSGDGTSWQRVPDEGQFSGAGEGMNDNDQTMSALAPWRGGFVAVGRADTERADVDIAYSSGPAVWTSPDGLTWDRVSDQPAFDLIERVEGEGDGTGFTGGIPVYQGAPTMASVDASDDTIVAVGWTEQNTPDSLFALNAEVWLSNDGAAWTRLEEGAVEGADGGVMRDVVAGGPGWVAVGSDEIGRPVAWTSVDGTEWSRVAIGCDRCDLEPDLTADFPGGGEFAGGMHAVAAGDRGLVAVGVIDADRERPLGAVWLSADGLVWRLSALIDSPERVVDVNLVDVEWDGDLLIAIGHDRDGVVWMSVDGGETWEQSARSSEAGMRGLAVADDRIVVVGWTYAWVGRPIEQ